MSLRVNNRYQRLFTYGLLGLILVSGLVLRTWNINFDSGTGSHPDERSTACWPATWIELPDDWETFKDPQRSPLNPLWDPRTQSVFKYTYGHFPLYLGVFMGEVLHSLAAPAEQLGLPETQLAYLQRADQPCNGVSNAFAGRLTIALLDTLTILLLFFLGRRMGGARGTNLGAAVGLLSAAFYAFAAQAVQLSHFFSMDPASTTFTVLAILGSVMMLQDRSMWAAAVAGLGVGLAVSSKFSALPIVVSPVVAGVLIIWGSARPGTDADGPGDARRQMSALAGVLIALAVAVVSFVVTSPYAVLDWRTFLQATLVEQGQMVRGVADFPFTRQYRNTTPYLYFIQQQVQWGLWWPLGTIALAGTLYALGVLLVSLWRMLRSLFDVQIPWLSDDQMTNVLVWSWVLPYFAITGAFLAKFNRYMLPVLPFALLFGAVLIGKIWAWAGTSAPGPSSLLARVRRYALRTLAVVLALIGIGGGLFWSAAYVNGVYNTEHPWIIAGRWLFENAPSGSVILSEAWDDEPIHAIAGEAGMDRGSRGHTVIKWSPYEEDTAEKYEILKDALRQADYVYYSSKRIYDSVDELPERYPMTNLYYDAMWDGRLGFELALDVSTPPRLFGYTFEDRTADESWSLYDHPQVTIFRKVRDLSDAEFDALFDRTWEEAVHGYVGEGSPIDPLLSALGLGHSPASAEKGLLNRVIGLLMGEENAPQFEEHPDLLLETSLTELPVVDNYRWNVFASENPVVAAIWWWFVVSLLGWFAWPLCFAIFAPLRDRGYLLSRGVGWLLAGWLLWLAVNMGIAIHSVVNAWLVALLLGVVGVGATVVQWAQMRLFVRRNWGLLLVGEILFALAFAAFVVIRMANPDLWQPWFGGEKFMEFAFLNGILRSPTFPPVDPHFAGGFINYYYFGLYLVAYLIKLTGIYAEVAFNLAIPTLFALTVINCFAVAYSAVRTSALQQTARFAWGASGEEGDAHAPDSAVVEPLPASGRLKRNPAVSITILDEEDTTAELEPVAEPAVTPSARWHQGIGAALLGPLFVVILGNLDGFAQIARTLANYSGSTFRSALPGLQTTVRAVDGLRQVLAGNQPLPPYDFWGPSRVIPHTINEFPYWSFLFADLHPHLIGIPFAVLFLALLLALLRVPLGQWRTMRVQLVSLFLALALMLGTLASVNLWELPTYFGLGVLALLVAQFHHWGRVRWLATALLTALYLGVAYVAFLPFFSEYTSPAVGGVGLVREPDAPGPWLLIWGFFLFVLVSWVIYAAARRPRTQVDGMGMRIRPTGLERWLSLSLRRFGRLPRLLHLHRLLVKRPTFIYLLGITIWPLTALLTLLALLSGNVVLAICLLPLGISFLLLWRRGTTADAGALFVALTTFVGFGILAGTQVVFLKDFLQGGDAYRMNTLFKFFNQVWVLWGLAAAVALPRFWSGMIARVPVRSDVAPMPDVEMTSEGRLAPRARLLRGAWVLIFVLLLAPSFAYLIWGTPARLEQRMVGWRPEFGTLNGLDYMRDGVYTWRGRDQMGNELPAELRTELEYDWEAIQWLLDNVRGNAVVAESAEVDYYRAGGTRVASMTGLSGLRGFHASEQRFGEQVGRRDALHREFWSTPDPARTQELIEQLDISLIYAGQLERYLHPEGVEKLEEMAAAGQITPIFENEGVTIYGVPNQLAQRVD